MITAATKMIRRNLEVIRIRRMIRGKGEYRSRTVARNSHSREHCRFRRISSTSLLNTFEVRRSWLLVPDKMIMISRQKMKSLPANADIVPSHIVGVFAMDGASDGARDLAVFGEFGDVTSIIWKDWRFSVTLPDVTGGTRRVDLEDQEMGSSKDRDQGLHWRSALLRWPIVSVSSQILRLFASPDIQWIIV